LVKEYNKNEDQIKKVYNKEALKNRLYLNRKKLNTAFTNFIKNGVEKYNISPPNINFEGVDKEND